MATETIATREVSERKKINEMDAIELADYVSNLESKIGNTPLTQQELECISIAKSNYRQITGRPLTMATMCRK